MAGDALSENDDWRGVMQRIGLTSNHQARVMDPAWTAMRVNATAKETAIWMMEMRYEFLMSLDTIIQNPEKGFERKVSHLDMNGSLQPGRPSIPPRGASKGMGQPSVGTFGAAGPSTATTTQDPPLEVPGCQFFYKGGALARLDRLNDRNNALRFETLLSTPPGDFDDPRGMAGLYLTKQEKVAYEDARWAQHVVDGNVVPVGILRVAIPNELLSSICEVVGDNWRDYVWACRHWLFTPGHLRYLANFQWLTGPVCYQSNEAVSEMLDKSELALWKLERGESASQHITLSPEMIDLLNEHCVGKTWITNLAATGGRRGKGKA